MSRSTAEAAGGAHGAPGEAFSPRGHRLWLSAFLALLLVAAWAITQRPSAGRHGVPPVSKPTRSTTATASPQTTSGAGRTTSTTAAACSPLGVVRQWSLQQRAMRLIAAPSYDFNLPQLAGVVAGGIGGVLFIGSASPPPNLANLVAAAQAHPVGGVPVITMADEEGGGIQRLKSLVVSFAWPRQLAAADTVAQVQSLGRTVGRQLRAAGVDMDLAPVLDVDGSIGPNDADPDGSRSFSAQPQVAAAYGVAFMQGLTAGGEVSVVKHFPGLGASTGNSDVGPAHTQPYSALQTDGIPPFSTAVSAGAQAVMVANDTVPGLTTTPASLSPTVIQGLLRQKLGFQGAVLTDSLSAGAITSAGYSLASASVAAVEAGADLVLFGSTLDAAQSARLVPTSVTAAVDNIANGLVSAVQQGSLPVSRLDEAVLHVVALTGVDLCGGTE